MASGRENDARFMQRALELAHRGHGHVAPNPLVGAVVVRDGVTVGEGWHARFGGEHAESMALRLAGAAAQGATIYVSLEPCHHEGKTPPCTRAIAEAGIAHVVYAMEDPNRVAAGGSAWLVEQGIEVTGGVANVDARELNAPFVFARRNVTRPFVTVKLAVSIDGALVDHSRTRAWLTGAESRAAVHALRAGCDAIAIGVGTAIADDPDLTVREAPAPRVPPRRVVFDRQARLPVESRLVQTARKIPLTVITDVHHAAENAEAGARLRAEGVTLRGAPDLASALGQLRLDGIEHLLVEGGAVLASAFMEAGFVDRLITFQAPVILGEGALPAFVALPARAADTAPRLRVVTRREYGADLMTIYAVSGD